MTASDLAAAARGFIGAPFRLHGRDPATGIDCIGLFAAAMRQCGRPVKVPSGYALRLSCPAEWLPDPASYGFTQASPTAAPGDVVLLSPGPAQLHLAIQGPDGLWIHAHAGLRRVVAQPALPAGELVGRWRLAGEF